MDPSAREGEKGKERRGGEWKYVATRFPNFRTFQKRRGFMGVPRSNEIPLGRVCVSEREGEGRGKCVAREYRVSMGKVNNRGPDASTKILDHPLSIF